MIAIKNQQAKKNAFSLIELSIVILIIGILVAGVTQGSRLIAAFQISNARTLTQSSAVHSIRDIVFWLDATAEGSILNQNGEDISNGDTVSSWQDSNFRATMNFCTQGTIADQPEYIAQAINNLPAIRFSSAVRDTRLASCNVPGGTRIESTIFIVMNWISSPSPNSNPFVIGNGGVNTALMGIRPSGQLSFRIWDGASDLDILEHTIAANENLILTRRNDPAGDASTLYQNGVIVDDTTSSIDGTFSNTSVTIGNWPNGNRTHGGDIAEIIVFDRALRNEERESVEKYLSQKWGINLSPSS
jgi:prepilin-type N-terminal cleavage/methylation domain-containing protein